MPKPMITLDANNHYVTLINTFAVDPERAEQLVGLLSRATEETMRYIPGFVSANLHVSLDRRHVANYAQWRSRADYEAMLNNPVALGHMKEAAAIAVNYTPILYELRHVHAAGQAS